MWIVRLALRRPYTFVVMSVLIAILGGIAVFLMPTDIFPEIDIPVVSVIWNYSGISPEEMEKRIVSVSERTLTTTVDDIEHIESESYNGRAVIHVYFHPGANVDKAIAELAAVNASIVRRMPPGIFPPFLLQYNAASVPVLQLGVSSPILSEQQLFDLGANFIRVQLATVQGASIPMPYGGKQREIRVDLDPQALFAKGLSATDVNTALGLQNIILPAGNAKFGSQDYLIRVNSSPRTIAGLNDLPIKTVNGAVVYMRDVAQVHDGYAIQTNIVRQDGTRSTLVSIRKTGHASTLQIVDQVKQVMRRLRPSLPQGVVIKQLFDQSLFVKAAVQGVLREGLIAALLTGLMILLFLGSWRSTVIVCISIPLSILTSEIILWLLGQTTNVMTLGGLALAVGILVDDATVEIENIHRNLGMKKSLTRAILDGAQQIAVPAFVSTLAICIVFVPVLMLSGVAKHLFTPLAMAVVFAMLASYLLSRTLVPTMVHFLLRTEAKLYQQGEHGHAHGGKGLIWAAHAKFNQAFEALRNRYRGFLEWGLHHRATVAIVYGAFVLASFSLAFVVGRDFFPYVDSGQMRLHVRAPVGTRIEETERTFGRVEDEIRRLIPKSDLDTMLDNIGLPNSSINTSMDDSGIIGPADGEILIALKDDRLGRTKDYERLLRRVLNQKFPAEQFYFQAANITNEILNFGIPMPIDVQVIGQNPKNYGVAADLAHRIAEVPGAVDVHVHQEIGYPEVWVDVDRSKAGQLGLTQRDIANSLLISLSGSGDVSPTEWLNFQNGVNYDIAVQTPQYRITGVDDLTRTPIAAPTANTDRASASPEAMMSDGSPYGKAASVQLLQNLATIRRGASVADVTHYNIQNVFDVYANVDNRDLGGVASEVDKIIAKVKSSLPNATELVVRGQVETMQSSFFRLGLGLLFAILLVYLLMVVNFQSWVDPFIILMALPGALAGILWMLFATQTTLNVPSLMGSIMCIGVATANSILLVTFANDERIDGRGAVEAALSAGYTRIRPVLMTAAAMIIGMAPMALGLGEGGEQNAPLGRAVIGGLLFATFSTLLFVPIMYTFLRKTSPVHVDREIEHEAHEGETV
jgi:multidrug efflux pump subunit AcrB